MKVKACPELKQQKFFLYPKVARGQVFRFNEAVSVPIIAMPIIYGDFYWKGISHFEQISAFCL